MTLGNEIRTRNERKLSVGVVRAGVGMTAGQWGLESVSCRLVTCQCRDPGWPPDCEGINTNTFACDLPASSLLTFICVFILFKNCYNVGLYH